MKIAMFTDVLLEVPGGIGSSISAAKKSLQAAGHEVKIFAPGWHDPEDPDIILVPTLKFFRPNGAPWAHFPKSLARWIATNHPELADFDVFHAHYEGPTSLAAISLAKKYHKPLVQTLHGREDQALAQNIPLPFQSIVASLLLAMHQKALKNIDKEYPAKTTSSTYPPLLLDPKLAPNKRRAKMWQIITGQGNAANLVISPSQHFADKLHKMGLKTPIVVLPNGVDDDIIPISPKLRVLKPGEPLKILWNSRLSKEKRFMPLLEALKIAGDSGLKYELTAYGTGNDLKKAKKYATQQRLNIKFMGSASRPAIFRTSTRSHLVAVASYDFDTHGLILVEAEACGTPVLICDPDMASCIAPGSFVLTKTPAPADIAAALLDLAEHPNKISGMSAKMLAHRQAVFQSSRINELIKIYKKVSKN